MAEMLSKKPTVLWKKEFLPNLEPFFHYRLLSKEQHQTHSTLPNIPQRTTAQQNDQLFFLTHHTTSFGRHHCVHKATGTQAATRLEAGKLWITLFINFLQTGRISLGRVALNIITCFSWGVFLNTSCTSRRMSGERAEKTSIPHNH